MRLTEYRFGRIAVDGVLYDHDVIVTPSEVREWRRREGHRVRPEDLEAALAVAPQTVVIGTGFSGLLVVTTEVVRLLREQRIEPVVEKTGQAVAAFNDLARGKRVCALLHLTC